MQIGRRDILWNYAATFLKVASSVLLFPFILKKLPSETVGIWTIFVTITSFASLLDLGFNASFTRNISYIFSGVKSLKVTGITAVVEEENSIDYGLLKATIKAMQWFYMRVAIILFFVLTTLGTWYLHSILKSYSSNPKEVYIAWFLLCLANTYNIYSLYYESLLQGQGEIKKAKQIMIVGQGLYLLIAATIISAGFGLSAIVLAQAFSVVIIRWLSYLAFFTDEMKKDLSASGSISVKGVLKAIYPNAVKIGFTSIGSILVQRSAIIVGSLYLSLDDIASYGITTQIVLVISGLSSIYTATYQPAIARLRVERNNAGIKKLYLKGQLVQTLTYLVFGLGILLAGNWLLNLIGSRTLLLPVPILLLILLISFLENNHAMAGVILLTNNEVPFFKASLLAGIFTVVLLFFMFATFPRAGLWPLVLAPGIAHLYNNWKWPHEVYKQLDITFKDFKTVFAHRIKRV